MENRTNPADTFRPPLLSAAYAGAAAYGGYLCYGWGQTGTPWATPAALGAGVIATRQLMRALDDRLKLVAYRRTRKRFKAQAMEHGTAKWATAKDLKQRGLIGSPQHGVFLGSFEGKDVYYTGENSGNIFGPPGVGKSTCVFLPTLLSASAKSKTDRENAPSFIVNDSSFELFCIASKSLRKAGYDVVVLSSWADTVSQTIGEKVYDEGLNLFGGIDPESLTFRDDIKRRVKLLIPTEKPGTDEPTKFFNMGGRSLYEWAAMYLVDIEYEANLKNILNALLVDFTTLRGMLVQSIESKSFGGYLRSLASGLLGMLDKAPETFSGYIGVVKNAAEPYGFGVVDKHIEGPGFDVNRIKGGDKPVAVFLMYPSERIETHQAMLNAELTYLLETVCKGRRQRPVIALIDEAFGAGYLPMLRFLAEGRKFGLRIFLGWQDMAQAEFTYTKQGLAQIIAAGHVLWASGIREPGFCDMLQKVMGTRAVDGGDLSLNDRSKGAAALPDLSFALSNKGVPLMRDIRTELGPDQALLIYENMSPCILTKVPYFTRPAWQKVAGKSPYAG